MCYCSISAENKRERVSRCGRVLQKTKRVEGGVAVRSYEVQCRRWPRPGSVMSGKVLGKNRGAVWPSLQILPCFPFVIFAFLAR